MFQVRGLLGEELQVYSSACDCILEVRIYDSISILQGILLTYLDVFIQISSIVLPWPYRGHPQGVLTIEPHHWLRFILCGRGVAAFKEANHTGRQQVFEAEELDCRSRIDNPVEIHLQHRVSVSLGRLRD